MYILFGVSLILKTGINTVILENVIKNIPEWIRKELFLLVC